MIKEKLIVRALMYSGMLALGACGMESDSGRGQGGQSSTRSSTTGGGELSRTQITQLQQALKARGFDPGTTDGVMGGPTQQALRKFQEANGLRATGTVDAQTAKALGLSTSSTTPSSSGQSTTGAGTASSPSQPRDGGGGDSQGGAGSSSGSSTGSGSSSSGGSGSRASGSSSGSSGSGSGGSSGGSSGSGGGGSGGGAGGDN